MEVLILKAAYHKFALWLKPEAPIKCSSQFIVYIFLLALLTSCSKRRPEELFAMGKDCLKKNDMQSAYKYFLKAVKFDPENPQYQWAAAKSAKNTNAAYVHAKKAWDAGLKSKNVLLTIVRTNLDTTKNGKMSLAGELYRELPDSARSAELYGNLHFNFGSPDSSLEIWKSAFEKRPSAELCFKLALAHQKSGRTKAVRSQLNRCRQAGLLNQNGYVLLALSKAAEGGAKQVEDLFAEAAGAGIHDTYMQLQRGAYYSSQNRFKKSEDMLLPLAASKTAAYPKVMAARLLLGYNYLKLSQKNKLLHIRNLSQQDSRSNEPERLFFDVVASIIDSKQLSPKKLDKLEKLLPSSNAVSSICAGEWEAQGNYQKALGALKRLNGFFAISPGMLVRKSAVLARLKNTDEALSILSRMHGRRVVTRQSLELLRDLCMQKGLRNNALAAQRLLEKKFPEDREVLLKSALLAERTGEYYDALKLYSKLSRKFPDDYRFEIRRVAILFQKGEYAQVIAACERINNRSPLLHSYHAKALIKSGRHDKAEQIYKRALENKKDHIILLEYANFLVIKSELKAAARYFSQALDMHEEILKEKPAALAAVLNNYAWSLMQIKPFQEKLCLRVMKRANSLLPGNPQLLDTYSDILMKAGRSSKVISLLKNHPQTQLEPALLLHLAKAYHKSGNPNMSSRIYKRALERFDKNHQVPITLSKTGIQEEIRRIDDKIYHE